MSAPKLTAAQRRALKTIAEDGTADGLYYGCRGPNPAMARSSVDRTMSSLLARGLLSGDGSWTLTDAGRAALKDGGS